MIFDTESVVTSLRKLDLSFNNIQVIPKEIGLLSELRELWLQCNPIQTLPAEIDRCTKLEVIDVKNTPVTELPNELCNLKRLHCLDFSETPFASSNSSGTDLTALKKIFHERYARNCLRTSIYDKLVGEVYVREMDKDENKEIIRLLVEQLNEAFPQLDELLLFSRRVDKLLPEFIADINEFVSNLKYLPSKL